MLRYSKSFKDYSRSLRENMTEAERLLPNPPKSPFHKGRLRGITKLDGGQHYSSEGKAKDRQRDGYMRGIGLRVLRFSDKEVFENTQGVLERIWGYL